MESKNVTWELRLNSNNDVYYWSNNTGDDENLIQSLKDKVSNEKNEVCNRDLKEIFKMKNMTEPIFFEIFKHSDCKPFCSPRLNCSIDLQKKIILFDIERLTIKDIEESNAIATNNVISILNNRRNILGGNIKGKLRKKIDDILDENIISNKVLVKWEFFYRYDLAFNFLVSSKSNMTSDVIESIRNVVNCNENVDALTVLNDCMKIENITDIQRRNMRRLLVTLAICQYPSSAITKEQVKFLIKHVFCCNHLKELLNSNMIEPVSNILLNDTDIMDDIMESCNINTKKNIISDMIYKKVITYPQLMEITKKYKIPMSGNTEMAAINTLEGSSIDDLLRCLNKKVTDFIKKEMESVDLNISFNDLDIDINIGCSCKDEINLLLDLERYKHKEE